MGKSKGRVSRSQVLIVIGLALGIGWGCTGGPASPMRLSYFATPDPEDAWSRKIRAWQARERGDSVPDAPAEVAGSGEDGPPVATRGDLKAKYDDYRAERKRAVARDLAGWIQSQAPQHYVADGPIDHWATLEETFRSNGDDCDGLELLTYYFLRDLGFGEEEVFRAIVYRRSDGQHHMVTLWFEDPSDPWVIDPTGAMTLGMPRMSEVDGWAPLKVFSKDQDYTVRALHVAQSPAP
jgi:hypothetical protein